MAFPTGLSSQAIAGDGIHHPWDPGDLRRCMNYCDAYLSTQQLQARMAGRSIWWDRLLPEWDNLVALLRYEMETQKDGRAPRTYAEMRRVLAGGVKCPNCDGTGEGDTCSACKGTGKRSGGTCRARRCVSGSDSCPNCRGNGYTTNKESTQWI